MFLDIKFCLATFLLIEKESTLRIAEQRLLEEDLPKSKKRKRVPNKLFLDTTGLQDTTAEPVAKKVIGLFHGIIDCTTAIFVSFAVGL